jgi:hypothetical protein
MTNEPSTARERAESVGVGPSELKHMAPVVPADRGKTAPICPKSAPLSSTICTGSAEHDITGQGPASATRTLEFRKAQAASHWPEATSNRENAARRRSSSMSNCFGM